MSYTRTVAVRRDNDRKQGDGERVGNGGVAEDTDLFPQTAGSTDHRVGGQCPANSSPMSDSERTILGAVAQEKALGQGESLAKRLAVKRAPCGQWLDVEEGEHPLG